MKFVFYTTTISPHQLPLARELIKIFGVGDYRYIYTTPLPEERSRLGWTVQEKEWIIAAFEEPDKARQILEDADVVMMSVRDWRLVELRSRKGLLSIYTTERWCKPPIGMMRFLFPSHIRHLLCLNRFLQNSSKVLFFPTGIHSASDMARLCGLVHGDLRCLFRAPELELEKKPGGRIYLTQSSRDAEKQRGLERKYCLDKMRVWGYFVESSKFKVQGSKTDIADDNSKLQTLNTKLRALRVLWVGRLLDWKRVDTIIRAVGELSARSTCSIRPNTSSNSNSSLQLQLDIYGTGPKENRLKKLAAKYGDVIRFYPAVPIAEVRKLMREHDVYVLASNAYEGWGAVVSEALEEGMKVLGTYEAGASATILPKENLFHTGDWQMLAKMILDSVPSVSIGQWTAINAAKQIEAIYENCLDR